MQTLERVDDELYNDFEAPSAKKARAVGCAVGARRPANVGSAAASRAAQGMRTQRRHAQGTPLPGDDTVTDITQKGADGKRQGKAPRTFYRVTVKARPWRVGPHNGRPQAAGRTWARPVQDNGTGMPHEDIPQLLGRVLSGTKYGVQQTRGKFGLGAKMALIWSKMSTGMPIDVRSARQGQAFISHYSLDIDIHRRARRSSCRAQACSAAPAVCTGARPGCTPRQLARRAGQWPVPVGVPLRGVVPPHHVCTTAGESPRVGAALKLARAGMSRTCTWLSGCPTRTPGAAQSSASPFWATGRSTAHESTGGSGHALPRTDLPRLGLGLSGLRI